MPIESVTIQESFADWWKRKGPTPPLVVVTLADVAKVAFRFPDAIVGSIPGPPFTFTQIAQYTVDLTHSASVNNNPDGSSVITLSLSLPSATTLNDVAGLGPMPVSSLSAILSTATESLTLEAIMRHRFSPKFSMTFGHLSPMELYLQAIGYEKTEVPSITAVASSITGPDSIFSFLRNLPTLLFNEGSFNMTWKIDIANSQIVFSRSPFGIDVQNAELIAVTPPVFPTLEIAGYKFSIEQVALVLTRNPKLYGAPFELSFKLHSVLSFSSGTKHLHFYGTASGQPGPICLEFVVSSQSSLTDIFECLGLRPVAVSLPFGGPSPDLNVKSVLASFKHAPVLLPPSVFIPSSSIFRSELGHHGNRFSLQNSIPESPKAIRFQLDYPLTVTPKNANLLVQVTCEVASAGASDVDSSSVASVRIRYDDASSLPSPSIGVILENVANSPWRDVTDAIPVLGEIASALAVTDVYLEVGKNSSGSLSVMAFSIIAKVHSLSLLANPSIVVDNADLTLSYIGSQWTAEINTTLLFANQFACAAELKLPTQASSGHFRFDNLDESFTFGELAKSIDPTIDLTEVPVVGSDFLATLSLGRLHVDVQRVAGKWEVLSFEVEMTWGSQNIGQLRTSSSNLTIRWTNLSSAIYPSSATTRENAWAVQWDGQLCNTWRLSAALQLLKVAGESTSRLVVEGTILYTGRTQAGALVDMLTRQNLEEDSSSTWQATLPTSVNSSFHLTRCRLNMELGDTTFYSIAAQSTWGTAGQGSAALLVEKVDTRSVSDWSFILAIGMKNFRFTDVYDDSHLAKAIDDNLAIVNVYVLIFRRPKATKLSTLIDRLSAVGASDMLAYENGTTPLSGYLSDADVTAGFAVLGELDIHKAAAGSLSDNLGIVMNSKSPSSDVRLFCYLDKATASKKVIFTASISSIQLGPSVTVKDVELSYEPVADSQNPNVYETVFKLQAVCDFKLSDTQQWSLTGASTITKTDAIFTFSTQSESISHLGALRLDSICLRIEYTFSSTTLIKDSPDDVPNQGTVTHGGRLGKYTLALSAKVLFGSVTATLSLLFIKGIPHVVTITVPDDLNISILVRSILEVSIAETILDITLSKMLLYFVWGSTPVTIKEPAGQGETQTPVAKTYSPGFHAEAAADVYGIKFDLSVDVRTDGADKGITVSGTKKTPFEVICIILHDTKVTTEGPSFGLSTSGSLKGCFIDGGITLCGSVIGAAKLTYQPNGCRFLAAVTVNASIFPHGSATVEFELVHKEGKNHFRFVNLPTAFDNLLTGARLIESIKNLTSSDKCGPLVLAFDQLVKSTVTANVTLADPQPPENAGAKVSFNVTGHFSICIGDHTIDKIDFQPLVFTIEVPRSLDAFGTSLFHFLEDSIQVIVKGLVDNAPKLAEVVAFVAVKKLTNTMLTTLLCRENHTQPEDKPDEPQEEPDEPQGPEEPEDGGGELGSGVQSAAELAVASEAGDSGPLIGGVLVGVVALGALVTLFTSRDRPSKTPPRVPPPYQSKANDPFAKLLLKDFDRWQKCTSLSEALRTVVACAVDYRDAIAMLRRVLTSKEAVSKLTKKVFDDWSCRRAFLIYRFSLLSTEFADKWLRPHPLVVDLVKGDKISLEWTNLPDPACITIVSLLVDGKFIIDPTYAEAGVLTVDRPLSLSPQKVTAMGAIGEVSKTLPPNVSLESPLSSEGGVVAFPIDDGMELTSPWVYQPNVNGPVITAKQDCLTISRDPETVANQWTMLRIQVPKPVEGGVILQFDISYSFVEPPTEVQLTLPNGVILRYDGSTFNYVYWQNERFNQIAESSITINQQVTTVALAFSPFGVAIFENGSFVSNWNVSVTPTISPVFNWQILNAGSKLQAQLKNILLIPPTYFSKLQTPWNVDFYNGYTYPNDIWSVPEQPYFSVTNSGGGYMRVATTSLNQRNSWVYPRLTLPLVEPTGLVVYRMRVNVSTGSESKITVIGGNILRITDDGTTVLWTLFNAQGQFVTLAQSSIVIGSDKWTNVQVIYSPVSISLLENGVYKYTRTYPAPTTHREVVWWVQHLDFNTAISVDLSSIRAIPLAIASPPPGTYHLCNFKYQQSWMDVMDNTLVIGYPPRIPPTINQQWELSRQSDSPSDVRTYTLRSLLSANSYVSSQSPLSLTGTPEQFVVEPVQQLGVWSINTAGNRNSVVTLSDGLPRAQVILDTKSGDNMKWILLRV